MHRWLPIIIAIYVPVSLIITYSIAVKNDHVEPGFPYISYTGTRSPESCVFSQLLNIGAVLGGIIVYIRYRQHHFCFEKNDRTRLLHLNTATFITGLLAAFGISLVGNFQGYAEHLVATVSEWLVVFVTVIYFATFYTEFKHFEMKPLEVGCHEYVQRLKEQQVTGPTEETTRNSAKFSSYGTTDLTGKQIAKYLCYFQMFTYSEILLPRYINSRPEHY